MNKSDNARYLCLGLGVWVACLTVGARADDTEVAPVKGGFFSSLTQAFKFDPEHDVVLGHFDVGSAPDMHRFYCVVNEKSGERRPNAVSGETQLRKDGKTRLKAGAAVSSNSCESAASTGVLVTTGYVLTGIPDKPYKATKAAVAQPAADPASGAPATLPAEKTSPAPAASAPLPKSERVDVAGIRLGMSPDEVRSVLRGRKFGNYFESANPVGSARSMNTIAAWNTAKGSKEAEDGEAFEIMFTPLPGHERVVAIVHTVGYSAARAVPETALQEALVNKYKGYSAAKEVPGAATWHYRHDGSVQVGDECNRRSLFGGMSELSVAYPPRDNIVLKTPKTELLSQLDSCGASIITEDHLVSAGAGSERLVHRFTVSAYSPALAAEAAGGLRAAESSSTASGAMRFGERPARDL